MTSNQRRFKVDFKLFFSGMGIDDDDSEE